ncbi:toxic anion resistance protein [Clostridium massiliamazoniense]|uniref:toxic anion resistance protein n=1 Tax=Clostridium massiliamazoniense TaxID=1347366 RepID=UPI0006D8595D|nr:toxic anion resistance protein [Clostridium massiliamazoniense]
MNNNEELNMNKAIDVEFEGENPNGRTSEINQNMNNGFNMNNSMGNQGNYMNNQYGQHMNNPYGQQINGHYDQQMNNQYGQHMNNGYGDTSMNMGYGNQGQNMNMGSYNQGYNGQQNQNMGNYGQGMNFQQGQPMGQQNMNYQNQGMGYQNQGQMQYQNNMNQGYGNGQMNMGYQNMNPMDNSMAQGMNMNFNGQAPMNIEGNAMPSVDAEINEYKQRLRGMKEVQALTSEVDIQNTNSIINFGQQASDNISKISDELLNSMKSVKAEEASEMLNNLTKIMDKFDVKELENAKPDSMFSKMFKSVGNTVAKLFQKYDTMGYEVQKVYVLLKKYESDIREANSHLKRLYDGNLEFYRQLEKYIVAGEMAIEEIDNYLNQIPYDNSLNQEEKQMLIQKLEVSKDMMAQRVYDLQIAENVAIQAAPMIQTIQMSNFNLMRKINSSFIVTLPIFKQCLAQAVILKRQEIQAKSMKQLDDKTNELIMRNAANTARQSVEIAKLSSGSSVSIETLQKSFETIMKGIEDTKAIQETNRQQRKENSYKLETIKADMKKHISGV